MTNLARRLLGAFALCGLCLAFGNTSAAGVRSVAYVSPIPAFFSAYLIDWQGTNRAHVVANPGNRDGTVVGHGVQRVITLDQPFSTQFQSGDLDSCIDDIPLLQQDTLQVAVTITSGTESRGTSAIVELGTITTLNGCAAGQVVPFGSLTDPGFATNHVAMKLRPAMSDLVPGVALAGPSEMPRDEGGNVVADVMTFEAGGLGLFGATGDVLGATINDDGWLQLALPSGQRAYARILVDHRNGAEVWIDADWSAGQPTSVRSTLMVKPAPGAGFGTVRQASRVWESGLFFGSRTPLFVSLFRNGTGDRDQVDLDAGTESHTPITWAFNGANIVQSRIAGSDTQLRTWKPLRNSGGTAHFVMEDEVSVSSTGEVSVRFPARVNFYIDEGAAAPSPSR